MDQTTSRIAKVLGVAEQALREEMIEATRRGEYAAVDVARSIALQLSRLSDGLRATDARAGDVLRNSQVQPSSRNGSASKRHTRDAPRRADYPRFTVEGDTLTMVGWSKRARQEYAHKVPRASFDVIIQAMGRLAQRNRAPFKTEDLLGEIEASNAGVAQYHVYAVLRLLRHEGHAEKRGRAGHAWNKQIEDVARKAWNESAGVTA